MRRQSNPEGIRCLSRPKHGNRAELLLPVEGPELTRINSLSAVVNYFMEDENKYITGYKWRLHFFLHSKAEQRRDDSVLQSVCCLYVLCGFVALLEQSRVTTLLTVVHFCAASGVFHCLKYRPKLCPCEIHGFEERRSCYQQVTTMPRAGNTATTAAVEGGQQPRPSNPIAALIRQGAQEAGRQQGSNRAVTKVQRMINSLQWRQAHSKDEFYPLTLGSGIELRLRQLQAGEVTGLGTGATVWPAAHVLAKYLELRYNGETGMRGLRVVDLGSGTGVAGIAAAALGAAETFLTDQEQLLFLMQENAERCTTPRTGANADTTDSAGTAGDCTAPAAVHVVTYDWGMNDDSLSPPVDVILVSDCVLPKLYPIEPLVDAIDKLSGPGTVTIMSYEHRHYQAFDPRRRFEELAAERGFYKSDIPQSQQHPIFSADDIEIWEVRRNGRPSEVAGDTGGADPVRSANAAALFPADGYVGGGVVISQCASNEVTGAVNELANTTAQVMMLGERHELSQSLSGAIGCYLWPSAVVMARHLVAAAAITSSTSNAAAGASLRPAQTTALELGSGVGLVAMAVALMGWDVVATDKADALPLLEANVKACLSSTERECIGERRRATNSVVVKKMAVPAAREHFLAQNDTWVIDGRNVCFAGDRPRVNRESQPPHISPHFLDISCEVCKSRSVGRWAAYLCTSSSPVYIAWNKNEKSLI